MKQEKVFIIAEAGNLHNGSLQCAKQFAEISSECGADAIKFQTHIFDAESLLDAPNPPYFKGESREKYFQRTAFDIEQWQELKKFAEEKCKIEFISSAFSQEAVDLLEKIGVHRHKIPSGEVTNIPLLEQIAFTRKPVLLSSGMSSWKELDKAMDILCRNRSGDITVLQCTSIYPCPPEKVGLNVLEELKNRYNLPVGFSDHTVGYSASIGAVVLGAVVIEKHFALSHEMYGPDAKHSLEPEEFKTFVRQIRDIEQMRAAVVNKDVEVEKLKDMKIIFEKSIVTKTDIAQGTLLTMDVLGFKKPGDGIRADRYHEVIGKRAKVDIKKNTKITKEIIE